MTLPKAQGPYRHSCEANGLVFVSGQMPIDPDTGEMPSDIESQARICISNLLQVLKDAGAKRIVNVTLYLKDINDFAAVNKVYGEMFIEPYPTRSCVEVSNLPKGAGIEISAIGSMS